jgi:hypothetical protein
MAPTDELGEASNRHRATKHETALTSDDLKPARFGPHENVFDAFKDEAQPIGIDPDDGLMRPMDNIASPAALPLSEETMVCLADERLYVEVFDDELSDEDKKVILRVHPSFIGGKYPSFPYSGSKEDQVEWFKGASSRGDVTSIDKMGLDTGDTSLGVSVVENLEVSDEVAVARFLISSVGRELIFRSAHDHLGKERARRSFDPDQVQRRWGGLWALDKHDRPVAFVRPVRPQCKHFRAQLSPASDVENEGKIVEPLDMYCDAFKSVGGARLSLMDESVTACFDRSPRDLITEEVILDRIRKKVKQGRERTMVPFLDRAPEKNWQSEAMSHAKQMLVIQVPREFLKGVPSDVATALILVSPSINSHVGRPSSIITLCDDGWQPNDEFYVGTKRPLPMDDGPWGQPNSGQTLARLRIKETGYTEEGDAALWPDYADPMLRLSIHRHAEACAKALSRGNNVSIVARSIRSQASFFAAMVWANLTGGSGLEALQFIESKVGEECATDLAFRVFLRSKAAQEKTK